MKVSSTEHLWQAFTSLSDIQELNPPGNFPEDDPKAFIEYIGKINDGVNHVKRHINEVFGELGEDARIKAMMNITTCTLDFPNKSETPPNHEVEIRRCDTCNVAMSEGYVIGGGEEYFCDDHEPEYFKNLFDADPDGDTYWTEWEGVETSS